jgi:hypothetical protein
VQQEEESQRFENHIQDLQSDQNSLQFNSSGVEDTWRRKQVTQLKFEECKGLQKVQKQTRISSEQLEKTSPEPPKLEAKGIKEVNSVTGGKQSLEVLLNK